MTAHTPGPWVIKEPNKIGRYYAAGEAYKIQQPDADPRKDWSVAQLYAHSPNAEANARLIAAAPDMYEALKDLASRAEDFEIDCTAARAALAKAEGQP